jgi:hypothetical protein
MIKKGLVSVDTETGLATVRLSDGKLHLETVDKGMAQQLYIWKRDPMHASIKDFLPNISQKDYALFVDGEKLTDDANAG